MRLQDYTSTAGGPWHGIAPNTDPLIVDCNHPTTTGDQLCPACVADLRGVLADIPALLADLELARTKIVSFVAPSTPHHDDNPDPAESPAETSTALPWSEAASRADRRLRANLAAATAALALPDSPPATAARLITGRLTQLARRDDATTWARRLTRAAAAAHRAIDRPPSLWYYGPCPTCGRDIYTERVRDLPHAEVACPRKDCAYSAPLADHRLAQLDAGEDRMLTVGELVGAITSAGEHVTRDQINSWIRREGLPREPRTIPRLTAGGKLMHVEVYVYRLGDVRRLALEAEQRRAEAWAGGWE